MLIFNMVLHCAGTLKKTSLSLDQVTADLTTTVIHSYKLLINDIQPLTTLILIFMKISLLKKCIILHVVLYKTLSESVGQ